MGRPRKPEAERLVPAKVCLTPLRFDQLSRIAQRRGEPLSVVLSRVIEQAFREPKRATPLIDP